MDIELVTEIDHQINRLFIPHDPLLDEVMASALRAGMHQRPVTPSQGKLLYLLARMCRAKRILEIGTLAGYSTIWMARALPDDGKLLTLENNPLHVDVARGNILRAGLSSQVSVVPGQARESLLTLIGQGVKPFDLVFLDGDKANHREYFSLALELSRLGTVIVADNAVLAGRVFQRPAPDLTSSGAMELNKAMAEDDRVEATIVQVVGSKGHDGLAIALVTTERTRKHAC